MGYSRRAVLGAIGGLTVVGAAAGSTYGHLRQKNTLERPTAMVPPSIQQIANDVEGADVEAHGGVSLRQILNEELRDPDAVVMADPQLVVDVVDRATVFATNALVLAYDESSEYATRFETDWKQAIQRAGIAIGRADPTLNTLGYRTVMALDLASDVFGLDSARVLAQSEIWPETHLPNVIQEGVIDAAVLHRNVAVQHDLPYRPLPQDINFGDPAFAEVYASVSFETADMTITGTPIRYGATSVTGKGAPWVERLVSATDRLREAGFVVPSSYPERNVSIGPDDT